MNLKFSSLKIGIVLLNFGLVFSPLIHAQTSEILPVCGIVASANEWDTLNPAVSVSGDKNQLSTVVKKGLHYNCASQLRMMIKQVTENGSTHWVSDRLTQLPTGRAVPDTIHPEDGEVQLVHLSIDTPATSFFRTCYPGYSYDPNEYCPADLYNSGAETGPMIFRQRHQDGTFESSPWVVSIGNILPGFVIRKKGDCLTKTTGCEYEIVFPKYPDGSFQLQQDTQVLIHITVHLDSIPETGDGFNSYMAIPMFVSRTTDVEPDPSPTPSEEPVGTLSEILSSKIAEAQSYLKIAKKFLPLSNNPKSKKKAAQINEARRNLKSVVDYLLNLLETNAAELSSYTNYSRPNLIKIKNSIKKASSKKTSSQDVTKEWSNVKKLIKKLNA